MLEKIEKRPKGVIAYYSGTITADDLLEANRQFLKYLEEKSYSYQISDYSKVENVIPDKEALKQVARDDMAIFPNHNIKKIAIVTQSPLVYGYARMYEAYIHSIKAEYKIFENLEEAIAWAEASFE